MSGSEVCVIPDPKPVPVDNPEWRLRHWLVNVVLHSRFFPLFAALVLLLFFLYPLTHGLDQHSILINVFVLVTFLVSLRAIARNKYWMRTLLAVAIPMFAARIWAQVVGDTPSLLVYAVLNSLFLLLILVVCLTRVLDNSPVTEDKIIGAICVYLLIGVIFSFIYEICYTVDPTAIDLGSEYADKTDPEEFWVFTYFSFVTLTTLGYGDVLPVSPFARSMATLEAVVGPLYLAILIARLVSIAESATSVRKREQAAQEEDS